ncbi:DUF5134 domain-containing protein [Streptomyces galilaeus]|uniref:DUF5134 domain-containing protein n=1 Tax=Streptomyces galilaeus TaxID=33899 RepID=UPI0038F69E43
MSDRTPALDAVHGMLTLLFTVVALHVLWHGVRSSGAGRRDRVDLFLHFAMAAAMAAMPWSLGRPLSGPATAVIFTAAALWFPLTAFRPVRPFQPSGPLRRRTATAGTAALFADRLPPAAGMAAMAWMSRNPPGGGFADRLPPAAGMAAMAWMSRNPPGGAASAPETLASGVQAAHHTAAHGHAAAASTTATLVTAVLTVYLLACAIRSLTRPMPALRTATDTAHRAAATDPYGHVRDGAMSLGTAVMLLLPH